MACYSNGYKQKCSKIVIAVSCLMGLMALISVIFGVIQMGKIPMSKEQQKTFHIEGLQGGASGIGKGNIAIGVVGLLIACLGCATGKLKNPCFAFPYGILTFIITIIFLVISIVGFGIGSSTGKAALQAAACGGTINVPQYKGQGGQQIQSNLNLAEQYKKFVDQPICSLYCPCPFAARFIYDTSKPALKQANLIKNGRYCDGSSNCEGYASSTYPSSSTISSGGLLALNFVKSSDTTTKTYNTYEDCYNGVLSKASSGQASASGNSAEAKAKQFKQNAESFLKGGGFEILNDIETKYNCAGFCQTPLFYVTKSVIKRPTQECISQIVDSISSMASIVGIVALISFFVNLCGFCGSFALCTKMEENADDNE